MNVTGIANKSHTKNPKYKPTYKTMCVFYDFIYSKKLAFTYKSSFPNRQNPMKPNNMYKIVEKANPATLAFFILISVDYFNPL